MGTDQAAMESEERFAAYVEQLASGWGMPTGKGR